MASRTSFTSPSALLTFLTFLLFVPFVSAQFGNIFEQMFGGGGGGHQHHQQHHQQQQAQNVPSDSEWYQKTYNGAYCDKYLCPDTLACVHFPHHCPCQWPDTQEKVELADGIALCGSKGGWKADEFQRKVELARKAML